MDLQWYHYAMGAVFLIAAALSYKTPRAWLWLSVMFGAYATSIGYLRYYEGMEQTNTVLNLVPNLAYLDGWHWTPLESAWLPPSAIAAFMDMSAAFLIHRFGRERWETQYLFIGCLVMMGANLLFFTGVVMGFPPLPPQRLLGIILDAINVALVFTIAGTGAADILGASYGRYNSSRLMGWFLETRNALHKPYKRKLWGE